MKELVNSLNKKLENKKEVQTMKNIVNNSDKNLNLRKEVKSMRKLVIILSILFFVVSVGNVLAVDTATNTATLDSSTLGLAPTAANITTFMQNVGTATSYVPNGTRSPGSLTDNPFKCVNTQTNFGFGATGCTNLNGNDPQTAPVFAGPNTATGNIIVNVPVSVTSSDGSLTIDGSINFNLDVVGKSATISETVTQNLNLGASIGTQNMTIANASATFTTADSDTANPIDARNIPWSVDITQTIPFPAALPGFVLQSAGMFPYAGGAYPIAGAGLSGSSFAAEGTFDLPGFGTGQNNFPVIGP